MSASMHDTELLGAYALGALERGEAAAVEEHTRVCAECRAELAGLMEMKDMLGELPPEAVLDGPPEGGDLMLRRTIRRVREERSSMRFRRGLSVAAAAAVAAVVLVAGGVVAGQALSPDGGEVAAPPASSDFDPPEGTVVTTHEDADTGTRATVQVIPAEGWVRVNASVTGIAEGERCRVVVVGADGTREIAGSWLVSSAGEESGTNLDGSALVAPEDVVAVEVENFEGETFVSVPV